MSEPLENESGSTQRAVSDRKQKGRAKRETASRGEAGRDCNAVTRRPSNHDLRYAAALNHFWFNVRTESVPGGVRHRSDDECWPWETKRPNSDGYASITVNGRSVLAHRFAYAFERIATPDEQWPEHVHHECKSRMCCNPTHLRGMTAESHAAEHLRLAAREPEHLAGDPLNTESAR